MGATASLFIHPMRSPLNCPLNKTYLQQIGNYSAGGFVRLSPWFEDIKKKNYIILNVRSSARTKTLLTPNALDIACWLRAFDFIPHRIMLTHTTHTFRLFFSLTLSILAILPTLFRTPFSISDQLALVFHARERLKCFACRLAAYFRASQRTDMYIFVLSQISARLDARTSCCTTVCWEYFARNALCVMIVPMIWRWLVRGRRVQTTISLAIWSSRATSCT